MNISNTTSLDQVIFSQIEIAEALDSVYLAFAAFLVFFMKAGFALLEAGAVTRLNVLTIMAKNFLDGAIGVFVWYALGFALAFGPFGNGFIGNGYYFMIGFPEDQHVYWLFQLFFASASTTIVSGVLAERIQFQGYFMYALVFQMWIFPVVAHWIWSDLGWASAYGSELLFGVGALDFAGGAVVHLLAATVGLVGCWMFGYRNQFVDVQTREANKSDEFVPKFEKDDSGKWRSNTLRSSNPLIGALGVFILFFGWFGFNGGSLLSILSRNGGVFTSRAGLYGRVLINTMMSGSVASLFAFFLGRIANRDQIYFKWSLNDLLNGLLAGLVCITPGAAYVDVWHAIWFGLIGACVYKGVSVLLASPRLRIDDPVDGIAVHGACGAMGMLLTGCFAVPAYCAQVHPGSPLGGAFYGGGVRLGAQIVVILAVIGWGLVWGFILFGAMWLVDRSRGKDALFLVRGAPATGIFSGADDLKMQEDQGDQNITGFVDPLAESHSQEEVSDSFTDSGRNLNKGSNTQSGVIELDSIEF